MVRGHDDAKSAKQRKRESIWDERRLAWLSLLVSACASFDRHSERIGTETSTLPESFLEGELPAATGAGDKPARTSSDSTSVAQPVFKTLQPLPRGIRVALR